MAGNTGRWGTHEGCPIDSLRLTITGTDAAPEQRFRFGDRVLVISYAEVGKETNVPKRRSEADGGGPAIENQRVIELREYAIFEPGDDVIAGKVSFDDLVAIARATTAARSDAHTEAEPPKRRVSVSEDLGPEGTDSSA